MSLFASLSSSHLGSRLAWQNVFLVRSTASLSGIVPYLALSNKAIDKLLPCSFPAGGSDPTWSIAEDNPIVTSLDLSKLQLLDCDPTRTGEKRLALLRKSEYRLVDASYALSFLEGDQRVLNTLALDHQAKINLTIDGTVFSLRDRTRYKIFFQRWGGRWHLNQWFLGREALPDCFSLAVVKN